MATTAIAAERCAAFSSPRLRPDAANHLIGRLDQRARCLSSSNAKSTRLRCCASSVERNVFVAATICAVGVCATAAVALRHMAATMPARCTVLGDKMIICFAPWAG